VSLYLLHLEPRYQHAGHYLGYTPEPTVERRVSEHLNGSAKASPLILAALDAGCSVTIARRWEGRQYDRKLERTKKNSGGLCRQCPVCRKARKADRRDAAQGVLL
jgi:hypothetical protein